MKNVHEKSGQASGLSRFFVEFFRQNQLRGAGDVRKGMYTPPCTLRPMKATKRPVFVSYQSEKGSRVDVERR